MQLLRCHLGHQHAIIKCDPSYSTLDPASYSCVPLEAIDGGSNCGPLLLTWDSCIESHGPEFALAQSHQLQAFVEALENGFFLSLSLSCFLSVSFKSK